MTQAIKRATSNVPAVKRKKVLMANILERALGEKGLKDLIDQYEEAKIHNGRYGYRSATPRDLQILDVWRKEGSTERELSQRFGLSQTRIRTSLIVATKAHFETVGSKK